MLKGRILGLDRRIWMVLVIVGLTGLLSCKNRPEAVPTYDKIPFTQSLREKHNLTPVEIKRLQFYVSDPIFLHQSISSDKTEVVRGKLMTKAGQFIDEVIVNKGTPGVAVKVEEGLIRASFEEKTSMAFVKGVPLDPDKYVLMVEKDDNGKDAVNFAGSWFFLRENTVPAHLLIAKGDLNDVVSKRRVLPGRRVFD